MSRSGKAQAFVLIRKRPQDIFDESAVFADVVVASFGRNELSAPHLVDIIAHLHRLSVGEKHMVEKGMPEDKAAYIVWRVMAPSVPFEEFQRHIASPNTARPEWLQAIRLIADVIRDATLVERAGCAGCAEAGACQGRSAHAVARAIMERGQ